MQTLHLRSGNKLNVTGMNSFTCTRLLSLLNQPDETYSAGGGGDTSMIRHDEQKKDSRWMGHSVSIELRGKYRLNVKVQWEAGSMTTQPSPSPPSPTCGRAAAAPRGTGCQSWGVLGGTGWWSSCAGRSEAAQPAERWTCTSK